ncbi:hypothetical protein PR202_gb00973 [Eleusine coracana subsp. coracana]|uniref:PHD finger protein ALFIN-LIKE n=1 Tax=Eleusine coracana subsp. coracana TaxID=191504 RepID=A0AAV5DTX2_ELECO|nr:hypothetical protein PR202_gb00973 [Eleusine coracana subsp. coracana]
MSVVVIYHDVLYLVTGNLYHAVKGRDGAGSATWNGTRLESPIIDPLPLRRFFFCQQTATMNSRPPQHQPGLASSSRLVLDLNVVPVEEPTEINPPAAPAPVRLQPPNLVTTSNVQRLFREFTRRRAGLIRAITTGLEPMHLYGHIDGSWEVSETELHMAPWHPKMAFGINKVRDNMERVQWLQEIARRCDAWLISVSYFNGAKSMLNADGRDLLFNSINGLPTVHEFFMDSDTYHRLCRENEERSRAADDDIIEVDDDEDMDDYKQMNNDDDYKEFENEEDSKEMVDYCKDADTIVITTTASLSYQLDSLFPLQLPSSTILWLN